MMGKTRINYIVIGFFLFRVAYDLSPFVAYFAPRGLNMISVVALYLLVGNELGINKTVKKFIRFLPVFLVSILAIFVHREGNSPRGAERPMALPGYIPPVRLSLGTCP